MAAQLEVDRVKVSYGQTPVLKGVSLTVGAGEFVALLGSSGCGKTTLLRAISGFVAVAAGAIRVGGREITHQPPDKREMAMVFQSYALWPHMSAAQNIGYGLKLRGWTRADIAKRVEEMLAMLKLDGLGERAVTKLSGGQRQRVALGRALAVSPQILLLDEPLSNLDARIREDVRHEIKALQQSLGITTIHVTHDREEAMVLADRIVILDAGTIAQVGPPEEVYNRPVSPFVAAFMGAANAIRLTAAAADDHVVIAAGPHNRGARLAQAEVPRARERLDGPVLAHFRSEAARLVDPDAGGEDELVLRGTIDQASYPGGFWRYGVKVGSLRFLVDDPRRLTVGSPVGIQLPAPALHLYREVGSP
ncbi:MAG: ABC transporter ATP-binding protein [Proteobacteria bacterium]|nr:ABC transporter ATP-binding protein [Pseudomonadota bacterium]MBI3497953.1 ABC transporter ATP-binding protein [Pseudomonadota bacterium]